MNASGVTQQDGQYVKQAKTAPPGEHSADAAAAERLAHAPAPETAPAPPARKVPLSTTFQQQTEGAIRVVIDININPKDFGNWRPETVTMFMTGLAAVLRAKAEVEQEAGVK